MRMLLHLEAEAGSEALAGLGDLKGLFGTREKKVGLTK